MKGTLHKDKEGWVVGYNAPGWENAYGAWDAMKDPDWKGWFDELPLHPDDVKYAEEGKEVEFVEDFTTERINRMLSKPIILAKLIQPKQQESWDDIYRQYLKYQKKYPLEGFANWLKENYNSPTKK